MSIQRPGQRMLRRQILQVGAIPMMGLSLADLLASESDLADKPRAKNVVLVWLGGGPSTIDMWDLKPNAKSEIRGEFRPISTSAEGIEICEHLPQMAKQMHHCTLIRSLSHTIAEHAQGTEHVLTGNPIGPALRYPSIGSIVSNQLATSDHGDVPVYVDMFGGTVGISGYLGASHDPFIIDRFATRRSNTTRPSADPFQLADGLTVTDLARRRDLLSKMEQGFRGLDRTSLAKEMSTFQQQALNILASGKTREALDVQKESKEVIQRYGRSPLGMSMLAARRLLQAGVRFVTVGMDGWDTHNQNFSQLRTTLLPQLDSVLSALISDLDAEGLLQETIVYCAGEFNRTPDINLRGGRDHWSRAMSVLLAGGGFKPGYVHGATDSNGHDPWTDPCSPGDVTATILHQLGIHPSTTLKTPSGRPMPLFREAQILEALS